MSQLAVMIYLLWRLPNNFAFSKHMDLTSPSWGVSFAIDLMIDMTVWLDIFMQMRLYHYDEKTKVLITSKAKIKGNYLRSWCVLLAPHSYGTDARGSRS